jgi:hypothetical protein
MVRLVTRFAFLALAFVSFGACHAMAPPNGPRSTCEASCRAHASTTCSRSECVRGCEMILDRTVEHEGDQVISCMARSTRGCSDTVWAECAARVGPRVDGGPPAPVTETFPDED